MSNVVYISKELHTNLDEAQILTGLLPLIWSRGCLQIVLFLACLLVLLFSDAHGRN